MLVSVDLQFEQETTRINVYITHLLMNLSWSTSTAIVFVYDYHPGAETLAARHFTSASALGTNGWETLASPLPGNGANEPSTRGIHKTHRHNSGNGKTGHQTLFVFIPA